MMKEEKSRSLSSAGACAAVRAGRGRPAAATTARAGVNRAAAAPVDSSWRQRPSTPAQREVNQVTLDARMQSRDSLRFTPAGVPALDFSWCMNRRRVEAGGERRVACELAAVALGRSRRRWPVSRPVRSPLQRLLARRYRTGITVALHVNDFELQPLDPQLTLTK